MSEVDKQVIDLQLASDGEIERASVKKMIYPGGDFCGNTLVSSSVISRCANTAATCTTGVFISGS